MNEALLMALALAIGKRKPRFLTPEQKAQAEKREERKLWNAAVDKRRAEKERP